MTEEAKVSETKWQKIFSLVGSFFVAVLALLIQYQYVQKKRAEYLLKKAQSDLEVEKAKALIDKAASTKTPRDIIVEMLKSKSLTLLLTLAYSTSIFAGPSLQLTSQPRDPSTPFTPGECLERTDCTCFIDNQMKAIAEDIIALQKCRLELKTNTTFQTTYIPPVTPGIWYQDPFYVAGGIVISFSLGFALGVALGTIK